MEAWIIKMVYVFYVRSDLGKNAPCGPDSLLKLVPHRFARLKFAASVDCQALVAFRHSSEDRWNTQVTTLESKHAAEASVKARRQYIPRSRTSIYSALVYSVWHSLCLHVWPSSLTAKQYLHRDQCWGKCLRGRGYSEQVGGADSSVFFRRSGAAG